MSFGGFGLILALIVWLLLAVAVAVAQRWERHRDATFEAEYSQMRAEMRLLEARAVSLAGDVEDLEPRRGDLPEHVPTAVLSEELRAALATAHERGRAREMRTDNEAGDAEDQREHLRRLVAASPER